MHAMWMSFSVLVVVFMLTKSINAQCAPDPSTYGACCISGICVDCEECACIEGSNGTHQGSGTSCVTPGICALTTGTTGTTGTAATTGPPPTTGTTGQEIISSCCIVCLGCPTCPLHSCLDLPDTMNTTCLNLEGDGCSDGGIVSPSWIEGTPCIEEACPVSQTTGTTGTTGLPGTTTGGGSVDQSSCCLTCNDCDDCPFSVCGNLPSFLEPLCLALDGKPCGGDDDDDDDDDGGTLTTIWNEGQTCSNFSTCPATVIVTNISIPISVVCGDGLIMGTLEECDDGNLIDGDGCSSNCTEEVCPNECSDGLVVTTTTENDRITYAFDLRNTTSESCQMTHAFFFDIPACMEVIAVVGTCIPTWDVPCLVSGEKKCEQIPPCKNEFKDDVGRPLVVTLPEHNCSITVIFDQNVTFANLPFGYHLPSSCEFCSVLSPVACVSPVESVLDSEGKPIVYRVQHQAQEPANGVQIATLVVASIAAAVIIILCILMVWKRTGNGKDSMFSGTKARRARR